MNPRKDSTWSLAARLTAWYAGSAALIILGVTGFLYWALVVNLDREDDQLLANEIHLLRRALRKKPPDSADFGQEIEARRLDQPHMTILTRVLDAAGRPLFESPGMTADLAPAKFPTPIGLDADLGTGAEIETASGKAYRIVAAQAAARGSGKADYVLQLAIDRAFEEVLLEDYRRNLLYVLAASLVICAAVSYLIARRGLRPLERMDAAAARIRSATLNERLDLHGLPAELSTLAATFNAMLERLEGSFQQLSRFSADIAHELRTPVNNVRGEAEVTLGEARTPEEYRGTLGSILEETGRLARLIDSLLFLARAESPQAELRNEPADLRLKIEAVCALYEAAAEEADVTVTVNAPEGLTVEVDRGLFQRAIANLLANAIAHTPKGGTITITAARAGDRVRLDVADTGGGIPPEHLPHVFDRFYRADPARTSGGGRVGLGLALVKRIVELHKGTVTIASEVGKGTRVTINVPSISPQTQR